MRTSIRLIVGIFFLIHIQCARKGSPSGGEKDTIPPILVNASPKPETVRFDKRKIQLTFNEFVKLRNIDKQLIVSPPLERSKYRINPQTGASKKVTIKFLDTLPKDMTYIFNFGKSIVDFNEENPMPYFSYTFSTGEEIDSLGLKGAISDALERKAERFVSIQLYPIDSTYSDSTIFTKKPFYVTNTLDTTIFEFRNLRAGKYKIIALKDSSANYLFDQNIDKIGFVEKPIELPRDSFVSLRLFKETTNFEWSHPFFINDHHIGLGYFGKYEDQEISVVSKVPNSFEHLITQNRESDTLNYWFKGINTDSLKLSYVVKDSLRIKTIHFRNPEEDSLVISQITKGTLPLKDSFQLSSNMPIVKTDDSRITVKNIDSIAIPFSISVDENFDRLQIDFDVSPNDRYEIELLPKAVEDFWGRTNDTLRYEVTTKKIEDYGNVFVNLRYDGQESFILELLDEKDKVVRSYNERSDDSEYRFEYLSPGKYTLRFIKDANGNKQWDTGNFLLKIQPEEIIYDSFEIEVRANWDENRTFTP